MTEPLVSVTALRDVLVVEPAPNADERGFFVRTLDAPTLRAAGVDPARFVQENQSRSRRRTLRGLHGRCRLEEAKLVRCAHGSVYEVVVDLRPWSETFLRWASFVLDDIEHRQVYVPPGCVHGFLVTSEEADVCYKHDAPYEPSVEFTLRWDDDSLGIDWPERSPLLSARDREAPFLRELRPRLGEWYGTGPPGARDG